MRRSFSLPLATLTLGAGTGCGSSFEGTWDMTSITTDGSRTYLPSVEVDGEYTYTYSGHITVEADGVAEIVLTYSYTYQGATQTEASVYSGTWENAGSVLSIEAEHYTIDCETDGTDMSCEGEIAFEPNTYQPDPEPDSSSRTIPVEIALTLRDAD